MAEYEHKRLQHSIRNTYRRPRKTSGFWVLKRVPLACSRITLGEGYGETDNGKDVQGNAKSRDGDPEPWLRSKDADNQDPDAQLGQCDAEEGPGIHKNHPKGGGWHGIS
ncbi:MAG: hypothetical protein Q9216_002267 [Gyalolechia sp. 2 TL-2023]